MLQIIDGLEFLNHLAVVCYPGLLRFNYNL